MLNDTIAAISSPVGTGAIGVVRISGNHVKNIIDQALKREKYTPKKMYYGWLYDKEGEKVDEITWVYHAQPYSYTGEDMLEIFCHGGKLITYAVLNTIIKYGTRQALPGEFTKRAVLNGKMDLIKAEAVNNVITSETEISLKASFNQLKNALSEKINDIKNSLLNISAQIEVEMDYPDEIELEDHNLKNKLVYIFNQMDQILKEADNGIIAVEGVRTVIAGKPNSGKSTLLNALLRKDRAIVTDIPGTTRDTIEENLNINGIYLKLIDTAGIRYTEDTLERVGIERTINSIKNSHLILFVLDGTTPFTQEDELIYTKLNELGEKTVIIVLNKSDSPNFKESNYLPLKQKNPNDFVMISAKNGEIKTLEDKIYEKFFEKVNIEEPTLTNQRQKMTLESSKEYVLNAINSLEKGFSNDVIMYDVRKALEKIYELSGENYTEELLDKIFSTFCVGK
ncbi:tRNA modification GTPase [Petrotoga miotherma DSM 10691]|uniref:tRNA modification GTPase MnmE n=2 Tax=Petrotoga TaxID=28236 RepID=A0A2K1P3L3_9BACT|nr:MULTISPECIES: tRNA uridine-5-carboxymethylaminomethyl(34) synthesis GTPase MnmE [Petrotoga]MDN5345954.1 tRNA modification GTPase [Petrotoga sp.]PNR97317.1 tRNA modification GTPase [Petrotoga miotherma DSM 10691]POZ92153.1 tRNA modification GTPase [Petrotoga halophila DSM 16923]